MKPFLLGLATLLLPLANPQQQSAAAPARHYLQLFSRGKAQAAQKPAGRGKKAAIIAQVLKWEGGYQNYPDDPANATVGTNWGITPNTYKKYTGKQPTTALMKSLTKAQAANIYAQIWEDAGMNLVPVDAAEALFDTYINTPHTCLKIVEVLTGCGNFANKMAIDSCAAKAIAHIGGKDFSRNLLKVRKEYYLYRAAQKTDSAWQGRFRRMGKKGSRSNVRFLKGWLARVDAMTAHN